MVRAEMLFHLVSIAMLHVACQAQPAFRHVQEDKLVVRVSDGLSQLGAGLGVRSVRAAIVHEKAHVLPTLQSPAI